MNARFAIALFLIMIGGALVRTPGIGWLVDTVPERSYSLHPDENRTARMAESFQSGSRGGYLVSTAAHVYAAKVVWSRLIGEPPDLVGLGHAIPGTYQMTRQGAGGVRNGVRAALVSNGRMATYRRAGRGR